ncbi:unnamed protein product [Parajaminaea phylloscopi]
MAAAVHAGQGNSGRRGSVGLILSKLRHANRSIVSHAQHPSVSTHTSSSPDFASYTIVSVTPDNPNDAQSQGKAAHAIRPEQQPKRRRSIWSKKSQQAPPVPELPPSLNFVLPFEQNTLPQPGEKVLVSTPTLASKQPDTEAADIARQVTQKYVAEEQNLRESGVARAKALAEARLTPAELTEVIKLAGSEIKQRGLANVGIFRPFRVGASPAVVDHLAELYLLVARPEQYEGVLSLTVGTDGRAATTAGTDLALATFGKPSARKELLKQLAYAKIHDVADFLKWAFRRLKVSRLDFASETERSWYTDFVRAENEAAYPKDAFSTLLLASLPATTNALLSEAFDLLTTVSAHYVANAMPAFRMCKTFGFWLFGRIGSDRPSSKLSTFIDDWSRSAAMMEHLCLAYLRDQSAKIHFMPTRLAQLIDGYPVIPQGSELGSPGLLMRGSDHIRAIKVALESRDLVVHPSTHPRGPSEILEAALTAKVIDGESSAEADDWTSLVTLVAKASKATEESPFNLVKELLDPSKLPADANDPAKPKGQQTSPSDVPHQDLSPEAILLSDEDSRIFAILSSEHTARRQLMGTEESNPSSQDPAPTSPTVYPSIAGLYSQDAVAQDAGSWHPASSRLPNVSRTHLSTLPEDASATMEAGDLNDQKRTGSDDQLGWKSFQEGGFDGAASTANPLLGLAFEDEHTTQVLARLSGTFPVSTNAASDTKSAMRRATSFGTLRRRSTANGHGGSSKKRLATSDKSAALKTEGLSSRKSGRARHTVRATTAISFDEVLIAVWQDACLETNSAARLPQILLAQLNRPASANLMSVGQPSAHNSPATAPRTFGSGKASGASQNGLSKLTSTDNGAAWLIIEETILPPRAPLARLGSAGRPRSRSKVPRIAANAGGVLNSDDDEDGTTDAVSLEGRRSLFAPSLRSLGASIRKRASLRQIRSVVGLRGKKRAEEQQLPIRQSSSQDDDAVLLTDDTAIADEAPTNIERSQHTRSALSADAATDGKPARSSTQSRYTDASAGSTPAHSVRGSYPA